MQTKLWDEELRIYMEKRMTQRCQLEKMFMNSGRMDTKLQYHPMQMPQVCMNQAKILMRKEAVVLGLFLLKGSLLPVAILSSQKSPSQCLHQGFQKKKAVIRFPSDSNEDTPINFADPLILIV